MTSRSQGEVVEEFMTTGFSNKMRDDGVVVSKMVQNCVTSSVDDPLGKISVNGFQKSSQRNIDEI